MFKIFTENGDKIGNGHVSRCLLLYNELVKRGCDVVIYLNYDGNGRFLSDINHELVDWWNKDCVESLINENDYAIVDSYIANIDILRHISQTAKNTLFFDDYDRVDYPKGLIYSPTLLSDNPDVISGEEYFLIRDAFYAYRKNVEIHQIKKIYLSLGTDVNNVLDIVLNVVLDECAQAEICVVTHKKIDRDRVKTFYNLNDIQMARLMNSCDFSIVACGQTMLENLIIGNPFIPLLTVDNQKRNFCFIKDRGFVDHLLDVRDKNFTNDFRKILRKKINNIKSSNVKIKDSRNAAEKIINLLIGEE